jgi:hypothetical protein
LANEANWRSEPQAAVRQFKTESGRLPPGSFGSPGPQESDAGQRLFVWSGNRLEAAVYVPPISIAQREPRRRAERAAQRDQLVVRPTAQPLLLGHGGCSGQDFVGL